MLETLFNALPVNSDVRRESYFAGTPAPGIQYVWDRMFDIETIEMRRAVQSGAPRMVAGVYYQSKGRGLFRGRGKVIPRNRGACRDGEKRFRCGEADHWSR